MKKTFLILSALLITAIPMMAQNNKDTWKERKELRKMSRDALKEKASKDARKEAKALTKEDWKAAPGALPLERQLDRSYMMQQEFDDDMFPKYLMGEGMSIGENYDGTNDAATVTQTVMGAKNFISQSIGRVITVVEVYRTKKNGNKEVLVRVAYNSAMAKEAAKKAVRKDLESKGDDLLNQLDKAMGW